MNGRCPGQGGGAAKTHKEPPSQLLSIDKLTNLYCILNYWNTETLPVHSYSWLENIYSKLYHLSLMTEDEEVQVKVSSDQEVWHIKVLTPSHDEFWLQPIKNRTWNIEQLLGDIWFAYKQYVGSSFCGGGWPPPQEQNRNTTCVWGFQGMSKNKIFQIEHTSL